MVPCGLALALHLPPLGEAPGPRFVEGKALVYDWEHESLLTDNFQLMWEDPEMDPAIAELVALGLEEAWTALFAEGSWPAPLYSEAWRIPIWLDPDIDASGYAYVTDLDWVGEDVPYMYVNPSVSTDPDFLYWVSAHELSHTSQFAVRDWGVGNPREAWFWESSAELAAHQAQPDQLGYPYTAAWYLEDTELQYYSNEGYHYYGLWLFNAHLSDHYLGAEGSAAADLGGLWSGNSGRTWPEEIELATGRSWLELWTDFAGALATHQIEPQDVWSPAPENIDDGRISGEMGISLFSVAGEAGERLYLDGGVGLLAQGESWTPIEGSIELPAGGGLKLVILNPNSGPLTYSWSLGPSDSEEGDSGGADSGQAEGEPTDSASGGAEIGPTEGSEKGAGRGCAAALPLPFLTLLLTRRRRT